jgi:hypothetical protein
MTASTGNKPATNPLNPGDVKPGDVLLSCGWGKISSTICLLDGGNYSHCAICAGLDAKSMPFIVEATGKGVIANQLKDDLAAQKYIDVYRFKADTGDTFESPEWPPKPVVAKAVYYKDRGTQYAYNQLLLMGMLILVRKAPVGKLGRARLRYWLDKFIRHFKEDSTGGKENVVCSELVYRCFYEAEAEPEGKYGLSISGTIGPDGHLIKAFASGAKPADMGLDPETAALFQKGANVLLQIKPDLQPNLRHSLEPGNHIGIMAANPNVCADMVTPYDLQKSPNLELIGKLERKPIRSWVRYLMSCMRLH